MKERIIKKLAEMGIELSKNRLEQLERKLDDVELILTAGTIIDNIPDYIIEAATKNNLVTSAVLSGQFALLDMSIDGIGTAVLLAYFAGWQDGVNVLSDASELVDELFEGVGGESDER